MNLDWKKIGIIALFVGAIVLFGFLIYFFFFRPLFVPDETPTNTNVPTSGQLPTTVNINGRIFTIDTNGQLPIINESTNTNTAPQPIEITPSPIAQGGLTQTTRLTDTPALFSIAGSNGQIIYYNPVDGKFYTIGLDGTITQFNNKAFFNVRNVTWSQGRDQAILEYPDGSNIVYNFKTNEQITLPQHWYDFSFSPTDQQIAFKSDALDPENRFLVASKVDGSQPIILENIGDKGGSFNVNWSPNNQMIATFTEGKDFDRTNVYFIGQNNENFKLMLVNGRDFRGQWSPEGDKMIYSVYNSDNDYKPELWISDASANTIGDNRQRLDIETWADKCTFSSNNKVYCAVPTTLPYGAGMDDASADSIPDQLYEIDLNTGSKTLIATPENNPTITNIIVDEKSNYLFFTDSIGNRIYRINL